MAYILTVNRRFCICSFYATPYDMWVYSVVEAEFFAGVKSGKVQVLEGAQISGQSAEVTSALPLTADEQASVKKDVLAKSGAAEVAFRVDPSILGGLVIRVGDKVMDGSVAGKLEGLRANLR